MNFDQWLAAAQQRQPALDEEAQEILMEICDALRDPVAPAQLRPEEAFDGLCDYCRRKGYSYDAVGKGLPVALKTKKMNCSGAADLVVGVVLQLSGGDFEVENFRPVFSGRTPVVTPPVQHPGVRIENNLSGGGNRIFFSGGHYIAGIDDDQYDLISGLRHHTIDFLRAQRVADVDGQASFECTINDIKRTLTKVDGTTAEGLSKFVSDPAIV